MIPGFNHNISYQGGVYHIQTEDSGVDNPHVITHLFVGGNIVESRKMSYADIVKSDKLDEVIIDLMQDQHKSMLKDLVGGKFDQKISQRSAGASHLDGPAPLNVDRGQNKSSVMLPSVGGPGASKQAPKKTPPAPVAPPQAPRAPAAAAPPAAKPLAPPVAPPAPKAPTAPAAPFAPLTPMRVAAPPIPVEHTTGGAVISADSLAKAFETDNKAAINSIFGEDLISEKSLDEVILSYLAEDVGG